MDLPYQSLSACARSHTQNDLAHLALRVRPSADKNSHRQERNTRNLKRRVPLASYYASEHGRDTAKAPKNDVDRDRNVEGEGPVVEHVDGEEEGGDIAPFRQGDFGFPQT